MKFGWKRAIAILLAVLFVFALVLPAFAAEEVSDEAESEVVLAAEETAEETSDSMTKTKAIAAAALIGVAAAAGAFGMAWSITKSVSGIARQPEAEGSIRTTLMLGLVFVETAIIYALVVAILIIFVL